METLTQKSNHELKEVQAQAQAQADRFATDSQSLKEKFEDEVELVKKESNGKINIIQIEIEKIRKELDISEKKRAISDKKAKFLQEIEKIVEEEKKLG